MLITMYENRKMDDIASEYVDAQKQFDHLLYMQKILSIGPQDHHMIAIRKDKSQ